MDKKSGFEIRLAVIAALLALLVAAAACIIYLAPWEEPAQTVLIEENGELPEFRGEPYIAINGNLPQFADSDITNRSFERYSPLDRLGRCGAAVACIGKDIMPDKERESISSVRPSGWQIAKYDNVNGYYLYNRCHLIGFQLAGENANEKNLITGTRYLNVDGMLPFENMVADYVKETNNHVMYRVTPVFVDDELVARGVQMEAYSVEDSGEGVSFNVYCFNEQPDIEIDHATGDSRLINGGGQAKSYIVNTNNKKFHLPECASVAKIKKENKKRVTGNREDLIRQGYSPCGDCKP